MFLQRNLMTATAVVYITTFLFALPLMCHKLGFSSYFRSPTEAYEFLEAQNEERIMNARNFFRNFDGKVDYTHDSQIEFSTVLLTAYRGSNTHYPLQVAARLLPQVINDEGKTVFNYDRRQNSFFFFLNVEIPSYLPSVTVEQVSTADFSSSLCWALWLKIKE